ncbi:MAG TPA: hypothetical protein DEB40_12985 [Elusimicrobia bacterium]|nr:hypothetical protein [Elusimicrobiota bacterium]HBT62649.1 hypothetical protein [Elusimicrobiota bacterium]
MTGMDLTILFAYFLAIVWIGMKAASRRKEGMEDYVLAGRSLTTPAFVSTLVPTFYGGLLGVGEFSWEHGLANWLVMGAPYYIFTLIYALFFAGKIRIHPGSTMPDHFEKAYGRRMAIAAACLIFLLTCPADELLMAAMLIGWATGWPLAAAFAAAVAIGMACLFKGGFRSDYATNRLQIIVMFAGFSLILPFAYRTLGGMDFLRRSLPSAHLRLFGGLSPFYVLTWYIIAVWTIVEPSFHQRVCAAKDARTARNGLLISVLFWCCFDFMTTFTGLYARALLPGLDQRMLAYPTLAREILPPAARGLFLAGLSSSMLASLESNLLISAYTLGKDALGRVFKLDEKSHESWTKLSLVASAALAAALAAWMPSVVELWYKIGSAIIPGLLLPLCAVYHEKIRITENRALLCSVGASVIGIAWVVHENLAGAYPLGLQPIYPGLAFSAVLWAFFLIKND